MIEQKLTKETKEDQCAELTTACAHCGGTGKRPLHYVMQEAYQLVKDHPGLHGAALAKLALVSSTQMNERLAELLRLGYIQCRIDMNKKCWTVREQD